MYGISFKFVSKIGLNKLLGSKGPVNVITTAALGVILKMRGSIHLNNIHPLGKK